ncbi:hypothetical protein BDY21DRAFT_372109 [Lineolata rhizophorae]|uniref:Uncharacterized protein n=1 Tax=Lineolata rhizophorae TaxID=578093 RepID=A0A6A6NZE4_9PEZI|nr:hypothetical protein BDY21DRAFT_372109 [Lineolata rhizophorae]
MPQRPGPNNFPSPPAWTGLYFSPPDDDIVSTVSATSSTKQQHRSASYMALTGTPPVPPVARTATFRVPAQNPFTPRPRQQHISARRGQPDLQAVVAEELPAMPRPVVRRKPVPRTPWPAGVVSPEDARQEAANQDDDEDMFPRPPAQPNRAVTFDAMGVPPTPAEKPPKRRSPPLRLSPKRLSPRRRCPGDRGPDNSSKNNNSRSTGASESNATTSTQRRFNAMDVPEHRLRELEAANDARAQRAYFQDYSHVATITPTTAVPLAQAEHHSLRHESAQAQHRRASHTVSTPPPSSRVPGPMPPLSAGAATRGLYMKAASQPRPGSENSRSSGRHDSKGDGSKPVPSWRARLRAEWARYREAPASDGELLLDAYRRYLAGAPARGARLRDEVRRYREAPPSDGELWMDVYRRYKAKKRAAKAQEQLRAAAASGETSPARSSASGGEKVAGRKKGFLAKLLEPLSPTGTGSSSSEDKKNKMERSHSDTYAEKERRQWKQDVKGHVGAPLPRGVSVASPSWKRQSSLPAPDKKRHNKVRKPIPTKTGKSKIPTNLFRHRNNSTVSSMVCRGDVPPTPDPAEDTMPLSPPTHQPYDFDAHYVSHNRTEEQPSQQWQQQWPQQQQQRDDPLEPPPPPRPPQPSYALAMPFCNGGGAHEIRHVPAHRVEPGNVHKLPTRPVSTHGMLDFEPAPELESDAKSDDFCDDYDEDNELYAPPPPQQPTEDRHRPVRASSVYSRFTDGRSIAFGPAEPLPPRMRWKQDDGGWI